MFDYVQLPNAIKRLVFNWYFVWLDTPGLMLLQFLMSGRRGGLMVSTFDSGSSSLDLSLTRVILLLCSWEIRHFTLTLPLSTQVYIWVPANCQGNLTKMLGGYLLWTSIPSRGVVIPPVSQEFSQVFVLTIRLKYEGTLADVQNGSWTTRERHQFILLRWEQTMQEHRKTWKRWSDFFKLHSTSFLPVLSQIIFLTIFLY